MDRTPRVVVLVPRRADGGVRDRLWQFCRRWWESEFDWPIIEGHHDTGPFNRSAAVNSAAEGDWDVALIIDGDVVASAHQVQAAVDNAAATGRLTLAYERYVNLNQQMTTKVLDGFDGSWDPGTKYKMDDHVSSILAVPRSLWDQVGGFDERFSGWGHDDTAFAQACRVIGGGIDRIPGTVWHLFHPDSPERNRKSSLFQASELLANRYWSTTDPAAMRALVAERATLDGITLVVVTHGRRQCISETIPSAEANLTGPIVRRFISDDSGDIEYQAWLRVQFPGYELVTGKPVGLAGNVIRARNAVIGSGQQWVFWLEDDFTFNRPVDLVAMRDLLVARPHLTQMALRRQAWFPDELAVGGFIEQHPDDYTDFDGWMEHRRFFTLNPHLTSRQFLIDHPWPTGSHSEAVFGRRVLTGTRTAGYWGSRHDEPWVHHFGERTGKGY